MRCLPALHKAAVEKILATCNPENKPLTFTSVLVATSTPPRKKTPELEIIRVDEKGTMTRQGVHRDLK